MRVALINEGIRPYRAGAVETWCHGLVRGLSEHEFHIVTLVDTGTERLYPLPPRTGAPGGGDRPTGAAAPGWYADPGDRAATAFPAPQPVPAYPAAPAFGAAPPESRPAVQVTPHGPPAASLTTVRVDGPPPGYRPGGYPAQTHHAIEQAAMLLGRGMLDEHPNGAPMFRAALQRIVAVAPTGADPLAGIDLPAILLDAWAASRGALRPAPGATSARHDTPPLPRPTMTAARAVATLLDMAVRPLAASLPTVDLCHTVNGGLSTMVALAAKWRLGVPYVLTEHSTYLSDPLLCRARTEPAVRALMMRFLRALTRLGYAEAAAIAPPSEQMRRWELENGAPRELVTMIPPGVDPQDNPPMRQEPGQPVIAWVGPDRERELALAAFDRVRQEVPEAQLLLLGYPPEGTRPEGVNYTGTVAGRRAMYAMAQLVSVSGHDPAMPYPLIEAMMCGRPTVCTESGGIAEMVGIGATVVPPDDPRALARAWMNLLMDTRLRREVSNSARQRSRTLFSLRTMLDGYQRLYARTAGIPMPRDELVLSS